MSTIPHAVVCDPGKGQTLVIMGDIARFFVTGDETNGRYAQWEAIVPPGGGPPPQVHSREDEGFYLLDGEITFHVDDQTIVAGPGTFVNLPAGRPHFFRNATERAAKMLITVAPAGLEKMFKAVGVPVPTGTTTSLPPTKDEVDRLLALAPSYGIQMLPER